MKIKFNTAGAVICCLLLALCFMFVTCKDPVSANKDNINNGNGDDPGDDPYDNPNVDVSRDFRFSHNSGVYSAVFSLSIEAAPGSTIYYSTDGSIPSPEKVGNGYVHQYSAPIAILDRNNPMQANVLATPDNSKQMQMVSLAAGDSEDDSRGSIPTWHIASDAQVPKATVIRAVAVSASGKKSDVVTKTYFIGNTLNGYNNTRIISLVSDPVNLVDENYGIMVRGNENNRWNGPSIYNFQRKGEDWERDAHMELFEGNATSRNIMVSTGVGIRVRGGYSRAPGQKSFTVYFKEKYGINNLRNYNLIPGAVKADGTTPVDRYKGFMLRSGANDSEYTKFYDLFLQDLLKDRSFTTQAGVPCIVYLNGEYWGPYNLQERYSDNHTEYKYGVDKDNVISYDNGELDDGNPGEESYWTILADGVINGTIDYDEFCEQFDIDNFIDYWAAQIYIYNEDWPQNNYRLFRTRNVESGNPYGDTKWRYQMFDVEFAMGIYSDGRTTGQADMDAFEKILVGDGDNNTRYWEHRNNKLFKKLLENEDFCRKFVNTIMDLYNVNFLPATYKPKLTWYAGIYKPLMGDENTPAPGTYFSRWGYHYWHTFDEWVAQADKYLTDIRDAMVNNYLPTYFGGSYTGIDSNIGSAYDVTFSTTGLTTSIKVNTITVQSGWTGKYFSDNLIDVKAPEVSNYTFGGWIVTNGTATDPALPTTTVKISGNTQIIAKYTPTSGVVPLTEITLPAAINNLKLGQTTTINVAFTPPDATYKALLWSSSDESVATVDGNGLVTVVHTGAAATSVTITAKALEDNNITDTCTVNVVGVTELLNFAEGLSSLTSFGVINDWNGWSDAFVGLPIEPAGDLGTEVTFETIEGGAGGTNKLQVNDFLDWASGLRVMTRPSTLLQAGDRIEIKGTFLNGPDDSDSGVLFVNTGCGYIDGDANGDGVVDDNDMQWWRPLGSWNFSAKNTDFQRTFILSAEDAYFMNANPEWSGAFTLRMDGMPDSEGVIVPTGIGSFSVEQIRVYRP